MARYTQRSSTGWVARLKGSFSGMLTGLAMILGAVWLLFWNEGRAVRQYEALNEGQSSVMAISAVQLPSNAQGKLVHLSGRVVSAAPLVDMQFEVRSDGLRLRRVVEMYQWVEIEDSDYRTESGGRRVKTVTYDYEREWRKSLINSGEFRHSDSHQNPTTMPLNGKTHTVASATMGSLTIGPDLLEEIDSQQPLRVNQTSVNIPGLGEPQVYGDYLYYGNLDSPDVGDLRIRFYETPEQNITLIGKLSGTQLTEFPTQSGNTLLMLREGLLDPEEVFGKAHDDNNTLTWGLRITGFMLMMFGFRMTLKPLRILADVVPIVGRIAGLAINLGAGLLAIAVAALTIGISWLLLRPLLAVGLLLVGAGALFMLQKLGVIRDQPEQSPEPEHGGNHRSKPPPPPPPPPPA